MKSKIDPLTGLKENVIVGKKIPAGTGSPLYRESTERVKAYAEVLKKEREERNAEKEEKSFIQELINN